MVAPRLKLTLRRSGTLGKRVSWGNRPVINLKVLRGQVIWEAVRNRRSTIIKSQPSNNWRMSSKTRSWHSKKWYLKWRKAIKLRKPQIFKISSISNLYSRMWTRILSWLASLRLARPWRLLGRRGFSRIMEICRFYRWRSSRYKMSSVAGITKCPASLFLHRSSRWSRKVWTTFLCGLRAWAQLEAVVAMRGSPLTPHEFPT